MKLKIDENIKKLRKKRNLTQEGLAENLGVSFQTVSKWERGDSYPDMQTLPAIAAFFDITLDELCGMNELRSEYRLEQLKALLKENYQKNRIADNIKIINEEIKYFPGNEILLFELGRSFYLAHVDESCEKENLEKAITAFEQVLKISTDDKIRRDSSYFLSMCYYYNGNREKAAESANRAQRDYMRRVMLPSALEGAEREKCLRENIITLTLQLYRQICDLADADVLYNFERYAGLRRAMLEKGAALLEWLYEDGDFLNAHREISDCYRVIGAIYMYEQNHEKAIEALEKAAGHAIAFDRLPKEKIRHTSLLIEGVYGADSDITEDPILLSHRMLNYKLTQERYDPIRRDARFTAIENRLAACIKECKKGDR